MSVLRDLGATLYKMFAADLVLTLTALAIVAGCAAAVQSRLLAPGYVCPLMATTIAGALCLAVRRGARP